MKIAVILAGCGRLDGSEIHESVLTLLSIKQCNAHYQCFSLNANQDHVSDHLHDTIIPYETRNMMIESARIARGQVKDITQLNVLEYDGLIIPGGNGVAYNLFNFTTKGKDFTVNPHVTEICRQFTENNKPVGFICIAPVMIPKIYEYPVSLTIGNDENTAQMIEQLGCKHVNCNVDDVHVDTDYKIVTTPAYMLANHINEVYLGIHKLVKKVIELC